MSVGIGFKKKSNLTDKVHLRRNFKSKRINKDDHQNLKDTYEDRV